MASISLHTAINSPIARVFDLARSIDLHKQTMSSTNEEAVAGRTKGLINENETVTWKAKHLLKYRLFTSKITAFHSPFYFRDEMQKGDFKKFYHEHFFEENGNGGTLMKDLVVLEAPFGIIGKIVVFLFLKSYIKNFLAGRNTVIKEFAETEKWKSILTTDEQQ